MNGEAAILPVSPQCLPLSHPTNSLILRFYPLFLCTVSEQQRFPAHLRGVWYQFRPSPPSLNLWSAHATLSAVTLHSPVLLSAHMESPALRKSLSGTHYGSLYFIPADITSALTESFHILIFISSHGTRVLVVLF